MGELNGDARKIELKIMEIQTRNEERWNAHDRRSEENWSEIKGSLKILHKLPCDVHTERMRGLNKSIGWIWAITILMIAGICRIAFAVISGV